MRLFLYLIWIILVIIGASFAVLNSYDVSVNFFVIKTTLYFPLLFLAMLFLGALLGVFALLPLIIKLKAKSYFKPNGGAAARDCEHK